jgi:bacillolysin/thermolysin
VERDPALPSRTVERFEQFHRDVRIWGADIVRDSERGVPHSIFGVLSPELTLTVDPSFTLSAAREALLTIGGNESALLREPELVIVRLDSAEHRLAFAAVVSGGGEVLRVFVDAHTGAELLRYSENQTQAAVGSGRGVLGDIKKLSVLRQAGVYVADDQHRPPILTTYDLRNDLTRAIFIAERGSALFRSDIASDTDNNWTDVAAVDAHVHIGWTYDYFFKRFGRRGLDDRDRPITVLTNAVSQQGALSLPASLLHWAVNAFWCGTCGPNRIGVIFFGNGIPPGVFLRSTGNNYSSFAGALDIVAHELTHGITDSTSRLIYRNESGALNEAFSDIMATSVEFFYHPSGGGPGRADYLIGEDISRAVAAGALDGDRSMENPELFRQPDHYSRYRRLPATEEGDWGGVHVNSGIPNQAFYLAIEGGRNRTSGVTVQGVGAANREQIERVFYRAFTTLIPSSANFSMARIATIQAARDLYGAGSAVERAITQAWDAVGVTNTSSNVPSITRMPTLTGTVPGDGGRAFYYYIVNMPATGGYQAVLNWNDASVDLDVMIGPPGCFSYSCMLTRAESPTRRPETVCYNVRSGEQYYVLLQNFSSRSATYELVQTIDPNPSGPCALPGPSAAPISDDAVKKGGSDVGIRAHQLN